MSHSGAKLSIVVPTFNDVDNVERLVGRLIDVLKYIDDNSPDGTASGNLRLTRRRFCLGIQLESALQARAGPAPTDLIDAAATI